MWSSIFDATAVIAWEHDASHPKETPDLKVYVFWLLHGRTVPPSVSLSLGLSVPWDTNIEIRPISLEYFGPIKALSVQGKDTDAHLSL